MTRKAVPNAFMMPARIMVGLRPYLSRNQAAGKKKRT